MTQDSTSSAIPSAHRDTKEVISKATKVLNDLKKEHKKKKWKIVRIDNKTWKEIEVK